MAKLITLLVLAFFTLQTGASFAETTRLELLVRSESKVAGIIGIKQLISNQHKNISLEDLEIERVIVEAKSRSGQGIISVVVGSLEGTPLRVPANPDFTSPDTRTFFSLELSLPAFALATQSWQLKTQGNIKVNRVLVYVTTKTNRFSLPSRITYQSVDKFRLEKFIETTKTIRLNSLVKAIRFIAHSNYLQVLEVRARLTDGREIYLDGLNERIKKGGSITTTLDTRRGVRIVSVFVRAISPNLIGSRADLEVQTGL